MQRCLVRTRFITYTLVLRVCLFKVHFQTAGGEVRKERLFITRTEILTSKFGRQN